MADVVRLYAGLVVRMRRWLTHDYTSADERDASSSHKERQVEPSQSRKIRRSYGRSGESRPHTKSTLTASETGSSWGHEVAGSWESTSAQVPSLHSSPFTPSVTSQHPTLYNKRVPDPREISPTRLQRSSKCRYHDQNHVSQHSEGNTAGRQRKSRMPSQSQSSLPNTTASSFRNSPVGDFDELQSKSTNKLSSCIKNKIANYAKWRRNEIVNMMADDPLNVLDQCSAAISYTPSCDKMAAKDKWRVEDEQEVYKADDQKHFETHYGTGSACERCEISDNSWLLVSEHTVGRSTYAATAISMSRHKENRHGVNVTKKEKHRRYTHDYKPHCAVHCRDKLGSVSSLSDKSLRSKISQGEKYRESRRAKNITDLYEEADNESRKSFPSQESQHESMEIKLLREKSDDVQVSVGSDRDNKSAIDRLMHPRHEEMTNESKWQRYKNSALHEDSKSNWNNSYEHLSNSHHHYRQKQKKEKRSRVEAHPTQHTVEQELLEMKNAPNPNQSLSTNDESHCHEEYRRYKSFPRERNLIKEQRKNTHEDTSSSNSEKHITPESDMEESEGECNDVTGHSKLHSHEMPQKSKWWFEEESEGSNWEPIKRVLRHDDVVPKTLDDKMADDAKWHPNSQHNAKIPLKENSRSMNGNYCSIPEMESSHQMRNEPDCRQHRKYESTPPRKHSLSDLNDSPWVLLLKHMIATGDKPYSHLCSVDPELKNKTEENQTLGERLSQEVLWQLQLQELMGSEYITCASLLDILARQKIAEESRRRREMPPNESFSCILMNELIEAGEKYNNSFDEKPKALDKTQRSNMNLANTQWQNNPKEKIEAGDSVPTLNEKYRYSHQKYMELEKAEKRTNFAPWTFVLRDMIEAGDCRSVRSHDTQTLQKLAQYTKAQRHETEYDAFPNLVSETKNSATKTNSVRPSRIDLLKNQKEKLNDPQHVRTFSRNDMVFHEIDEQSYLKNKSHNIEREKRKLSQNENSESQLGRRYSQSMFSLGDCAGTLNTPAHKNVGTICRNKAMRKEATVHLQSLDECPEAGDFDASPRRSSPRGRMTNDSKWQGVEKTEPLLCRTSSSTLPHAGDFLGNEKNDCRYPQKMLGPSDLRSTKWKREEFVCRKASEYLLTSGDEMLMNFDDSQDSSQDADEQTPSPKLSPLNSDESAHSITICNLNGSTPKINVQIPGSYDAPEKHRKGDVKQNNVTLTSFNTRPNDTTLYNQIVDVPQGGKIIYGDKQNDGRTHEFVDISNKDDLNSPKFGASYRIVERLKESIAAKCGASYTIIDRPKDVDKIPVCNVSYTILDRSDDGTHIFKELSKHAESNLSNDYYNVAQKQSNVPHGIYNATQITSYMTDVSQSAKHYSDTSGISPKQTSSYTVDVSSEDATKQASTIPHGTYTIAESTKQSASCTLEATSQDAPNYPSSAQQGTYTISGSPKLSSSYTMLITPEDIKKHPPSVTRQANQHSTSADASSDSLNNAHDDTQQDAGTYTLGLTSKYGGTYTVATTQDSTQHASGDSLQETNQCTSRDTSLVSGHYDLRDSNRNGVSGTSANTQQEQNVCTPEETTDSAARDSSSSREESECLEDGDSSNMSESTVILGKTLSKELSESSDIQDNGTRASGSSEILVDSEFGDLRNPCEHFIKEKYTMTDGEAETTQAGDKASSCYDTEDSQEEAEEEEDEVIALAVADITSGMMMAGSASHWQMKQESGVVSILTNVARHAAARGSGAIRPRGRRSRVGAGAAAAAGTLEAATRRLLESALTAGAAAEAARAVLARRHSTRTRRALRGWIATLKWLRAIAGGGGGTGSGVNGKCNAASKMHMEVTDNKDGEANTPSKDSTTDDDEYCVPCVACGACSRCGGCMACGAIRHKTTLISKK